MELTYIKDAAQPVSDAGDDYIQYGYNRASNRTYRYDGRTTKTASGVTRHSYYSNLWKPLKERIDASTDAERQHLWGARPNYRDELILRDRKTDALPVLDERLYCAMDCFSPSAVFDKLGVVQERYLVVLAFGASWRQIFVRE